jgi:uncharacterized transporter YbjL
MNIIYFLIGFLGVILFYILIRKYKKEKVIPGEQDIEVSTTDDNKGSSGNIAVQEDDIRGVASQDKHATEQKDIIDTGCVQADNTQHAEEGNNKV